MLIAAEIRSFGAAWAALGTLAVFTVPSVRHMTWLDASPDDQQASHKADPAGLAGEGE